MSDFAYNQLKFIVIGITLYIYYNQSWTKPGGKELILEQ